MDGLPNNSMKPTAYRAAVQAVWRFYDVSPHGKLAGA